MNLTQSINHVLSDLSHSAPGLGPEIALIATIVLLLVVPLFFKRPPFNFSWLALLGTIAALVLCILQLGNVQGISFPGPVGTAADMVNVTGGSYDEARDLFAGPDTGGKVAGLLRFDGFGIFFRIFLLFFLFLIIWLTQLTGIPDREDSPDFYTLLLGATLGMCLMVTANHLLMVFIAVEMASLPSYALSGFLKGRKQASEAALKYVVFGAGAAGIMFYGISLIVGKYGTAHLPTLAMRVAESGQVDPIALLAILLIFVGFAFKVSAVPFHFWCPDVFEGASAEVAGFLSIASKGAALALLARFTMAFSYSPRFLEMTDRASVHISLGAIIAILAAITATYGNMAAYAQTNLKRLLGYSTIAHAGYMMMPLAAAVALSEMELGSGVARGRLVGEAVESIMFYLVVYLFMNLGAFAVIALIRNRIGSEDLKDYRGLVKQSPFLSISMAIFLLSLTGIPPLAGFAAKFQIFAALYRAELHWLLVVGLINSVVSLFYYVKVLRVMIIDESDQAEDTGTWQLSTSAFVYCLLLVIVNLGLMVGWGTWDAITGLTNLTISDLLGAL